MSFISSLGDEQDNGRLKESWMLRKLLSSS